DLGGARFHAVMLLMVFIPLLKGPHQLVFVLFHVRGGQDSGILRGSQGIGQQQGGQEQKGQGGLRHGSSRKKDESSPKYIPPGLGGEQGKRGPGRVEAPLILLKWDRGAVTMSFTFSTFEGVSMLDPKYVREHESEVRQ